jgi:predicted HTH transcriptional regulator
MSGIIPSKNQTKGRERFAEAVKFAKAVMKRPEKYPEIKASNESTLYHAAIKAFLNQYKPDPAILLALPQPVKDALAALSLTEPQLRAAAYVCKHQKISNLIYRQINKVSKPTATRHLQELVEAQLIKSNGGKGAGAHYLIGSFFEKPGS